jgi:hypothetical protein
MNPEATIAAPRPRAGLGTWLLRIFLGAFLLAIAAPVAFAIALLHISGDTRALRNAAIEGDHATWKKRIELHVGAIPFAAARLALPFVHIDEDAKTAFSTLRSVEFSVHELTSEEPDRARVIAEADARMTKRGWERVVAVLNKDTAVAVYTQGEPGDDIKISALVLNDRHMVAVTGRGNLEPIFQLAMKKAAEQGLPIRAR